MAKTKTTTYAYAKSDFDVTPYAAAADCPTYVVNISFVVNATAEMDDHFAQKLAESVKKAEFWDKGNTRDLVVKIKGKVVDEKPNLEVL